jgi:hypothetical protein
MLSDDDLFPSSGDIGDLCRVVLRENVIGCGCATSYHGLLLGENGNEILKTGEAFPIAGVYGHCFFALNIENTLKVGGYLEKFKSGVEDSELQRESIAAGMPWWLHTGVRYHSMAKRYSAGGLAAVLSPEERKRQERLTHFYSFNKWPEYVSDPNKSERKVSCRWRKMMDDYIPDWRDDVPPKVARLMFGSAIMKRQAANPPKGKVMANPYAESGSTGNNTKERKEKARKQERCRLCWDKVPLKDQFTLENVDGTMVRKKNAARRGAEKLWHGCADCSEKRRKVTQRGIEREAERANGKVKPKAKAKTKAKAKKAPAKAKTKAKKAPAKKAAAKKPPKRKAPAKRKPEPVAASGSEDEPF